MKTSEAPHMSGVGNGRRAKTILIAAVSVATAAVIAVVAMAAYMFGKSANINVLSVERATVAEGRGTVVNEDNVEEVLEKMKEPVQDGYYRMRMNNDWTFPAGDKPSTNAYVENADTNTRTVYIDVFRDDTEELVYSSPFIPVGAKIEKFALDAKLPKGEYAATATYHLVDDNHNEITTASVAVTLRVEQ
jgi:hypothetical protein